MKRINSRLTYFYKRIRPMLMFGVFVLLVALAAIVIGWASNLPPLLFLPVPVLIAIIGVVGSRNLTVDVVDQVWDADETLVVRNKGEEDRIRLSDIVSVGRTAFVRPPRVTLTLRAPGRFGEEVSFFGPVKLPLLAESRVIEQLIAKVDAARRAAH
jgi:hypothetical protein